MISLSSVQKRIAMLMDCKLYVFLSFVLGNQHNIFRELVNVNTSGEDWLTVELLKSAVPQIEGLITDLLNLLHNSGTVPAEW